MNIARKLFSIAQNSRPKTIEPYVNELMKKAEKLAKEGIYINRTDYPGNVALLREDIGKRLYAEGFEVRTEYFPAHSGNIRFYIRWDKENPAKPEHKTY